ncbi:hypothetical protein [Mycobacterium sp.]|uniref:hypothetical protein n=1 Tax=Mycobacterium sp. TaxID=1785 RepID=UPI0031E009AB
MLASGLAQLAAKCEEVSAELGDAAAKPPVTAGAGWPSSAAVTNAAVAAGKDLAGIGARVGARGAHYSAADVAYTQTEDQSAAKLRALVV